MVCLYVRMVAQIVFESFPISSSGHVQLLSNICPINEISHRAVVLFDYASHFPTACIVVLFFLRAWTFPFRHVRRCWMLILRISMYAALTTIGTVIGYGLTCLLPIKVIPLSIGFFITTCSLMSLQFCSDESYQKLDFKKCMWLSMLQSCAFVPGVSRFALTFVGARWLRIPARRAFEISFLIEWPLILCASVYGIYGLHVEAHELLNPTLMCVMLGSSGVAYAGMCVQAYMIRNKIMWWWSMYMLLPLIITFLWRAMYA